MEVVLAFAVAFAPTLIAILRKHRNRVSIFLTQTLLALLPFVVSVSVAVAVGPEGEPPVFFAPLFIMSVICWGFTLVWAFSNRDLAAELLVWIRKVLGAVARLIGYLLAIAGLVCALVGAVNAYDIYQPVVGEFLFGVFLAIIGLLISLFGGALFIDDPSDKDKRNDSKSSAAS